MRYATKSSLFYAKQLYLNCILSFVDGLFKKSRYNGGTRSPKTSLYTDIWGSLILLLFVYQSSLFQLSMEFCFTIVFR